ncbi:tRNA (guanine(6)-N2)-methyltransferase THUMP3 [Bombina bombina]|uniref:tRNA (guanine(6)-N2)-methyltransferase THUMP3 n=1 Tax=Bombina bombina TaxID=8345 RepID=UPI00235A5853|nr:tRNA (guanine(6)-N2)-methyltransferase THUMP3 [Bombina bombina]XP_053576750.1 tRNA (guanine(6)-N2)-methyltransferase THUMP3 [Bombina bombina]
MSEVDIVSEALTEVTISEADPVPGHVESPDEEPVTIGATVPTGFEFTAAEEVEEKLGCQCKISKDRGKIYFQIKKEKLSEVHHLKSVDNLFVIVQEFTDFPFKDIKEEALKDFQDLAAKLRWEKALSTWELNNNLKKKKKRKKPAGNCGKEKKTSVIVASELETSEEKITEIQNADQETPRNEKIPENSQAALFRLDTPGDEDDAKNKGAMVQLTNPSSEESGQPDGAETVHTCPNSQALAPEKAQAIDVGSQSSSEIDPEAKEVVTPDTSSTLKFRVTCNRAGDKHSFTSNDAARDFGGAVQDHFQWKADMTNFDIEVLLNISYNEMLVGIALTEESLHRRNITHFGPTTLRSTLAYGMLRLCNLQPSDIVIDPMCGTGAIPIEGVNEWPRSFFLAGDNNLQAVNRAAGNIGSLLRRQQSPNSSPQGLPIDTVHWDISRLPLRNGSVDVIITDMPFGKRIGSRKKNWDLYPACLREMSRVCRPGTGRAVLLTHDRKCFIKALAKAGHLWRKMHTVWVNIGGLHAGVYLLRRTFLDEGSRGLQEETVPVNPDLPPDEK